MPILAVNNLSYWSQETQLLNGISLSIPRNKITALLGPNGAGKTTLMRVIMGLLPQPQPTREINTIYFNNELFNYLPTHARVAQGLVFLPQNLSLFNHMSVSNNLDLVFEHHPFWIKKSKQSFEEEKNILLSKIQLESRSKQLVGSLSGGQKRKLEIMRALLMHASCLMLDEPFAGVDPKSIHELTELFHSLTISNISIIISDHHVDQLLCIANLVYVVMRGSILTSGTPDMIINDHITREQYLGNHYYEQLNKKDIF